VLFGVIRFALTANFAITRTLFEQLGGFDERFNPFANGEDVDLCWRAERAGFRLAFVPTAVVHYRLRGSRREAIRKQFRVGASEVALMRKYPRSGLASSAIRYELRRLGYMSAHVADVIHDPVARDRWMSWFVKRAAWVGALVHDGTERATVGAPPPSS
jgi:GT2 family glycosyltransferase